MNLQGIDYRSIVNTLGLEAKTKKGAGFKKKEKGVTKQNIE